jgi:hypothetical protein
VLPEHIEFFNSENLENARLAIAGLPDAGFSARTLVFCRLQYARDSNIRFLSEQ